MNSIYNGIDGSTHNEFATPINGNPINTIHHWFGINCTGAIIKSPMHAIIDPMTITYDLFNILHKEGTNNIDKIYAMVNEPSNKDELEELIPYVYICMENNGLIYVVPALVINTIIDSRIIFFPLITLPDLNVISFLVSP